MIVTTLGRWTLAFWLEALLIAAAFMLFGWMTADLGHFLSFGIVATLLLLLGSLVFHESSDHPLLHLLLYPLVAGVGMLAFLVFHSWLVTLIVTGLFFWRIHSVVSDGVNHANLQRRFVLTLLVCLAQLTLTALIRTSLSSESFHATPFYWMLGITLGSYLLLSLLEYVTRVDIAAPPLPGSLRMKLGGQVLATHAIISIGYLLIASVVLGVLGFLWTWLKGPIGTGLYWLAEPILKQLAEWVEALAGVMAKDQGVHTLLNKQGQGGDQPYLPAEQGEPLISLLEPYLIAAAVLLFLLVLGRLMWKRHYRKDNGKKRVASAAEEVAWTPLAASADEESRPPWDVRQWFKQTTRLVDDPVRHAYYQFLQHTAARGNPIYRYETSQEYLNRLRQQWQQDPASLDLAAEITHHYELYRYREQSLTPDELTAMQQAVKSIRSLPAR